MSTVEVLRYLDQIGEWRKQNPIRLYRTQHDLTLQNLADILGEKYHTIYRWEAGISEPTEAQLDVLEKTIPKIIQGLARWQDQRPQRKE